MNKEIMEIIQPYMDKTLSEGCLIQKWQIGALIEEDNTIYKIYKKEWYKCYVIENSHNNNQYIKWEFAKILWHYDLTAVLKFLWNNNCTFQQTYDDDFIWLTWWHFPAWDACINIPHKPLHLYTAQEDKDLLELFKKLWIK